jgi:hypothetical protein
MKSPEGVEVFTRIDAVGRVILIVINHTAAERNLDLPWPALEHLTGQIDQKELKLLPYDVAILTKTE